LLRAHLCEFALRFRIQFHAGAGAHNLSRRYDKDAWIVERDFPTNFSSNSSQAHSAFITERGAIIGKIARRTLLPGAPIPSNAVAEPKVVLNGAKVKLIFKEGGLMIMTYGAALQAGAAGDVVSVRNLDSGLTISGIVQPDGSIWVSGG